MLVHLAQMASLDWMESGLRLIVACLCGGLIGWEREHSGRSAGLRTHMLVALGSAGFTIIGVDLIASLHDADDQIVRIDPTRIIAAIVGGIGFLGAGAIIQSGGNVRGLTTAAGMWLTAAAGTAAGLGEWALAAMLAVLGLIVVRALKPLKRTIQRNGETSDGDDDA